MSKIDTVIGQFILSSTTRTFCLHFTFHFSFARSFQQEHSRPTEAALFDGYQLHLFLSKKMAFQHFRPPPPLVLPPSNLLNVSRTLAVCGFTLSLSHKDVSHNPLSVPSTTGYLTVKWMVMWLAVL